MISFVQRLHVAHFVDCALLQVILKVQTHAAPLDQGLYAERCEPRVAADSGQVEDMRRADCAGGQNDGAGGANLDGLAVAPKHDAAYTAVLDDQSFDENVHLKVQIPARECGLQKTSGRGPAPAAFLVDVKIGDTFVIAAIEVLDGRNAELNGGIAHGIEYPPGDARRFDVKPAADSVVLAFAQEMILHAPKGGQHVRPSPALESERAPAVEVGRLASHADHGIDRG